MSVATIGGTMSSKPDGSDPRVLQPEGKTVIIASTMRQSKGRKYHRKGCKSLARVKGTPKEVDIAVARWKNMKKCSHCWDKEPDTDRLPSITAASVDKARKALAWSDTTCAAVAENLNVSTTTVRYHVAERREYDYAGELNTPEVEFDHDNQTWVWSE